MHLRTLILSLIGISLGLTSCGPTQPDFFTRVSQPEANEMYANGEFAKYIIIEDSFSPELKEALNSNDFRLKVMSAESISKIPNLSEQNFLSGVVALTQKKYQQASSFFIIAKKDIPQAELLMLDCKAKLHPESNLYASYQELYDRTEDVDLKKLIKNRYQFYRHGL